MAQESHVILMRAVTNKLQNFIALTKQKFISETYKIQLAAGLCYLPHRASKVPLEVNIPEQIQIKYIGLQVGVFTARLQ